MFDEKAYHSAYYQQHKSSQLEQASKRYAENREAILESRKVCRANQTPEQRQDTARYNKSYRENNREKLAEYSRKPEVRYNAYYKQASKRRGYEFELTLDEFKNLTSQPCYLCGDNAGGIDRLDNSIGYKLENCRPCCETCNKMKWALDIETFEKQIVKIYQHIHTK